MKYRGFWGRWTLFVAFSIWAVVSLAFYYSGNFEKIESIALIGLIFWIGFACGVPEGMYMRKHIDLEDETRVIK